MVSHAMSELHFKNHIGNKSKAVEKCLDIKERGSVRQLHVRSLRIVAFGHTSLSKIGKNPDLTTQLRHTVIVTDISCKAKIISYER